MAVNERRRERERESERGDILILFSYGGDVVQSSFRKAPRLAGWLAGWLSRLKAADPFSFHVNLSGSGVALPDSGGGGFGAIGQY